MYISGGPISGAAWVWVTLVVFSLALLLCFAPYTTLGPTVAEEHYGSTGVYGLLAAATGVGTMGGALLGFRLRPRHPMRIGMICVVFWPATTIGSTKASISFRAAPTPALSEAPMASRTPN